MGTISLKHVVSRAEIIAIHTLIFAKTYSPEFYARPLGLAWDPKELIHKYLDTLVEMMRKIYREHLFWDNFAFQSSQMEFVTLGSERHAQGWCLCEQRREFQIEV